jgi:hypothetical protein
MGRFASRDAGDRKSAGESGYDGSSEDAARWPTLVEFLSLARYDDGSSRDLGTLRILVEGGRLKVCFNDNASGRFGFAALHGLEDVVDALEGLLAADRVDWRVSKEQARGRK